MLGAAALASKSRSYAGQQKTLLRIGMQGRERLLTPVPFLEGQDVDDGSGPGLP